MNIYENTIDTCSYWCSLVPRPSPKSKPGSGLGMRLLLVVKRTTTQGMMLGINGSFPPFHCFKCSN